MPSRKKKLQGGYTLIETVIGLGIGFITIYTAFQLVTYSAQYNRHASIINDYLTQQIYLNSSVNCGKTISLQKPFTEGQYITLYGGNSNDFSSNIVVANYQNSPCTTEDYRCNTTQKLPSTTSDVVLVRASIKPCIDSNCGFACTKTNSCASWIINIETKRVTREGRQVVDPLTKVNYSKWRSLYDDLPFSCVYNSAEY